VLPIKDGLPKLKDFPEAIGGSGETLPESEANDRGLFADNLSCPTHDWHCPLVCSCCSSKI
jgi:hypothetical protein